MEPIANGIKSQTTAIEVGEPSVNISLEVIYLGVLLDQNLTLKSHIITKAKWASYHLCRIRQIVKFRDLPAKQTLISSLVISHLDYPNAIFVNLPNSSIYPMQQIQNQEAKLIMNKHWLDSPPIIMRQLHWLPIRFRCKYKEEPSPDDMLSHWKQLPSHFLQQKEDFGRLWIFFCRSKALEQPAPWTVNCSICV